MLAETGFTETHKYRQSSLILTLPEFLYGGLLLPCDNNVPKVVDGEEKDVPVTTEPRDEEGTGERLERHLNDLSVTHPGRGHTQHQQQTAQYLQSCVGTCLKGPALSAGLAARCLRMGLRTFLSWQDNNRNCIVVSLLDF